MARIATSLLKKRPPAAVSPSDPAPSALEAKPTGTTPNSRSAPAPRSATPKLTLNATEQSRASPEDLLEKPTATMNRQLATRLNAATEPYSYREMAVRTGCHPESIRRWLRGEGGDLPAHFLVAACRAFQISPHWLLTGEGTPSATHTSNKLLGTCAVSELFAEIVIRLQRAEAAGQPQSLGVAEVRTISQLSDPVRSAGSMANSTTKSSSRAGGQP